MIRAMLAALLTISFAMRCATPTCAAQTGRVETVQPGAMLDPSRAVTHVQTVASFHKPLPEEYIWTADDAAVGTGAKQLSQLKRDDWKVEPHLFRRMFEVSQKPATATLYVAGPRRARVWLNGSLVAEMQYAGGHHMGFGTMTVNVAAALRIGTNILAIEAVRGAGSHHHTNALKTSWLNSGEVLAAKIVPAIEGIDAPALLMTDASWTSAVGIKDGWQQPDFDASRWKPVVSLGGIESSPDFFQWNADAGMYAWPGYLGEAPYMANYKLSAAAPQRLYAGVVLDFGRELSGRIFIQGGAQPVKLRLKMGESMGELMNAPYLGEITLQGPAGTEIRGPKTGFRYALVHFEGAATDAKVFAEGIYYPATQVGIFESNDARVNNIFESSVYTAHLAMQDSILDGLKRDRGRWIGDDEVIDRVVADIYGDARLVRSGLEDGIGSAPVTDHVNGLPGYSAWWIVTEAEYIRRWGDLAQLREMKPRMLQLMARMERELDTRNVYNASTGAKPYIDWSKGLSSDSPEARRAMHFEYVLAFREAASLLQFIGEDAEAKKAGARADAMREAAAKFLKDDSGGYGDRWQTNAIAEIAGVQNNDAIWRVLSRTIGQRKPTDVITPYYGSYLLRAMAMLGHRSEALQWMKWYWGGMLDNGATSFWEAWDPAWAGDDPHAKLEADDKVGYNASLAHGWSSGPASWLLEEVLGVQPLTPGFKTVRIQPELAGLEWARGAVATPLGAVQVEVHATQIAVALPPGMRGEIVLPAGNWKRNGRDVGEHIAPLPTSGRFEFTRQ